MVALLLRSCRIRAKSLSHPRALLATFAILLLYGCAFTALHHFAAQWQAGAFSLWFPAAGLRFAFRGAPARE